MSKPVRHAALLEAIADLMSSERAVRTAPVAAASPVLPRATVLVAEDNPVNQLVITGMLAKRGLEAEVVTDGGQAVARAGPRRHAAVLMDCQMPTVDGYEATARIRANEADGVRVPIIAMTAHALEGDRERCLQAGMDDYLAKPLRADQLDAVLERWLGGPAAPVPRQRARRRGPAEELPRRLPGLRGAVDRDVRGVDAAAAGGAADGGVAGDAAAIKRSAHMLKGSCRNVGATAMADVSEAIEQGASDDVDELDRLLAPTVDAARQTGHAVEVRYSTTTSPSIVR